MLFQKNCHPPRLLSFHEILSIFTCFFNLSIFAVTGSFFNYLAQFALYIFCSFLLTVLFFKLIFIRVQWINNIMLNCYSMVLVSAVHESESVIHMHIITFFRVFSHLNHYRILNRGPCAIHQVLYQFLSSKKSFTQHKTIWFFHFCCWCL